jgi:hypothetical protein
MGPHCTTKVKNAGYDISKYLEQDNAMNIAFAKLRGKLLPIVNRSCQRATFFGPLRPRPILLRLTIAALFQYGTVRT